MILCSRMGFSSYFEIKSLFGLSVDTMHASVCEREHACDVPIDGEQSLLVNNLPEATPMCKVKLVTKSYQMHMLAFAVPARDFLLINIG